MLMDIKNTDAVKLRAKELKSGAKSLYLDLWNGATKKREYLYLHLYLYPTTTPNYKSLNAKAMQKAEQIRLEKEIQVLKGNTLNGNNAQGTPINKTLCQVVEEYTTKANLQASTIQQYKSRANSLKASTIGNKNITDITKHDILVYLDSIKDKATTTQKTLFTFLSVAFNYALQCEYIDKNPLQAIPRIYKPKGTPPEREHLTREEIKRLINTDCRNNEVKKAYLFSVFTGLRISDIISLNNGDLEEREGKIWLNKKMKKTKQNISFPLSAEALKWLDKPPLRYYYFSLPSYHSNRINAILRQWAKKAQINKYLTFHTARHTFATLALTYGVDIYSVSKLLGHADIKTTQIYAKIVDKKKEEAINIFNAIFADNE